MADDFAYNRTFEREDGHYGGYTYGGYVGDSDWPKPAFTWPGLAPIQIGPKYGRDFEKYATPWERTHSWLLGVGAEFDPLWHVLPVVDDNIEVKGHLGWFRPEEVWVELGGEPGQSGGVFNKFQPLGHEGFVTILGWDTTRHNTFGLVHPMAPEVNKYWVLTTIYGDVIAALGVPGPMGIESSPIQLDDLWAIRGIAKGFVKWLSKKGERELAKKAGKEIVKRLTGPGARRVEGLSIAEMENLLTDTLRSRRELGRLMAARNLAGEQLQRETLAALREWEHAYGRNVQFVEEGIVQKLPGSRPGNYMSLQGNKLMIEKQMLKDPKKLYDEVLHELAADALGVRGQNIAVGKDLAYVAGYKNAPMSNALNLLEAVIREGDVKKIMQRFLQMDEVPR